MAKELRRFTDEQIERANRVDVVEYARSIGLKIKRSGEWYKAKGKGGLYFYQPANTWHWDIESVGGIGAISLCMKLENKTWVEAVKTLINEEMEPIRHERDWKPAPEKPKEFHLPDVNHTYEHMMAYLTKTRGIEPSVLKAMIDRKYIYENTKKSCVFVGRDKAGNARHASVRSTNTTGKVFKQDIPGSQKAFSFNIPGNSGTINVFEAPIDLLSYVSLQKLLGKTCKDSYIALGGVTDKALERFLQDYPNHNKIRICTDNDMALNGEKWDVSQSFVKTMYIPKNKEVKGKSSELEILFRTSNDYARYVKRDLEAGAYYVSLPQDKLQLSDNGELYFMEISATQNYTLYKSVQDFENGKGCMVSGKELYEKHFFEMGAGDKAAVRIHEKYGKDYTVTRHRSKNKDFNEDLIAYRQQQENLKERVSETAVAKSDTDKVPEQTQNPLSARKTSIDIKALQQAGISDNLIQWYLSDPEVFHFENENDMFYEGTGQILYVCDSPTEILAVMDLLQLRDQVWKEEHYTTCTSVEWIQTYMQKHPQICIIGVATSRTEHGEAVFTELQKLETPHKAVRRMKSQMMTFLQSAQKRNELEEVITAIDNGEPNLSAGLEMQP